MNYENGTFDDLFANSAEETISQRSVGFDKDAYAEYKQAQRANAYALLDEATTKLAGDPSELKTFLDVQARFDRYSSANAILIANQKPDATRLADFDTWKSSGASIHKGENAIIILEPGKEYQREDGSTGVSMNVKKVFDIAQTSAEKPQEYPKPDQRTAIKALIASATCGIVMDNDRTANKAAIYSPEDKTIFIRQGMDGDSIFKALSQEIAAVSLAEKCVDRSNAAFLTYCSAYILCERNGIDTSSFNFDRAPAVLKDLEPKAVREQLSTLRDVANTISRDMSHAIEGFEKATKVRDDGAR